MASAVYHRIAIATDGSPHAESALEVAIELAKAFGADLFVVAVAPLPPVFETPNAPFIPAAVPESSVPRFREIVDASVGKARSAGVAHVTGTCDEGTAVDRILAQVSAQKVDLLIVGSRGLSTAQRLLLGSVSTALVTHAPCAVLVVRREATPPP